jgi:hypothetical protein
VEALVEALSREAAVQSGAPRARERAEADVAAS